MDALLHDLLRPLAVVRFARREESLVAPHGLAKALGGGQDEPVVAIGPPEQSLDLVDEPLSAARPIARRVKLPSLPEVLLHLLLGGESPQVTQRLLHAGDVLPPGRAGSEPRREALEPEPRRVDLLEVLARQPADERAAGRSDNDESLALELAEPGATNAIVPAVAGLFSAVGLLFARPTFRFTR